MKTFCFWLRYENVHVKVNGDRVELRTEIDSHGHTTYHYDVIGPDGIPVAQFAFDAVVGWV